MRVTQSMMAANSLRHLNNSYQNLIKYNDQLATGKKITRASQDPVIAMNGMRYRTQVAETEQFKRNLSETYNWMESSDASLGQTTSALQRVRELTIQASNDTYEATQRDNISKEVRQLIDQLESLGNQRVNNKYIFNGTNTTNQPITAGELDLGIGAFVEELGDNFAGDFDGVDQDLLNDFRTDFEQNVTFKGGSYEPLSREGNVVTFQNTTPGKTGEVLTFILDGTDVASITHSKPAVNAAGEPVLDVNGDPTLDVTNVQERQVVIGNKSAVSTNTQNVQFELLKGVNVDVNVTPQNVFTNEMFGDLIALEKALQDPNVTAQELTEMIDVVDHHINNTVNERAELGARTNRVEMIDTRVREQEVIAKRIMSDNEDADIEKVITDLLAQENVHRAALSATGRIIQPSLLDFLR
ncbi:flagellar hook-associated protein FlgL [Paenalkalicoccus suaedae]|uniref:Flagellar hook-associated protein FlgL n=1 Tax=Paenalkalicoccus suaedae TaxID=2592382 RepID=A0A859FGV9_9BACI|nr:flagellar hook-associated protein FlgL [Paenalkalicoccus suaedae]QKS72357.1 flagellar hook-associated protein FlgL [Paenalkalicoccus suaedae]